MRFHCVEKYNSELNWFNVYCMLYNVYCLYSATNGGIRIKGGGGKEALFDSAQSHWR